MRPSDLTLRAQRWRRRLLLGAGALALLAGMAAAVIEFVGVAPRLAGPYLERRASGHALPIEFTGRLVGRALVWLDRGELSPQAEYPAWTRPPSRAQTPQAVRHVAVMQAEQLHLALADAQPGDVITLAPGTYTFADRKALAVHRAGSPDRPITLRSEQEGTVTLKFDLLEGFLVSAPHWVFENLTLLGVCRKHSECAHAFHIVGAATHVVIRNNVLQDFDAHIKVNGHQGRFPDHGRIEGNQLFNTAPRVSDAPVVPIDLVGASGWRVEENLVADFIKVRGNGISYGAYAKGGGSDNVFARNVVLCEHRLRGAPEGWNGRRVGLSLGGGGSDPRMCRDGRCAIEQERSVLRENLIASCSDDGIYLNRAAQSQLLGNTLVDTAGIHVRFGESAARAVSNWANAPIGVRDGATLDARDNHDIALPWMYLGLARWHRLPCTGQTSPWAAQHCGPFTTKD